MDIILVLLLEDFQKKLFYNLINFSTLYIRQLLNFGLTTDTQTLQARNLTFWLDQFLGWALS